VLAVSERVGNLEEALSSRRVPCPNCGEALAPWGYARERRVRELGSPGRWWRPRRAWCASCSATHVLLPAALVARRKDSAEVIGTALLAKAEGGGHRSIARNLDRPAATVRGWIRSFQALAETLRMKVVAWMVDIDRLAPPLRPAGSLLGDALEALAALRRSAVLRFGPGPGSASFWSELNLLAAGLLG
jgi:hypothetical protein